jgi:hypothetical protein
MSVSRIFSGARIPGLAATQEGNLNGRKRAQKENKRVKVESEIAVA